MNNDETPIRNFWQVLPVWPVGLMVAIAVLALIVEIVDSLRTDYPPPGVRNYVEIPKSPDSSFSIVLPQFWQLNRLPGEVANGEQFEFTSNSGAHPIVRIDVRPTDSSTSSERSLDVKSLPQNALLSTETQVMESYDPRRDLVWNRTPDHGIVVRIKRKPSDYLLHFITGARHQKFDESMVIKVIDSIRFGDRSPPRNTSPVVATSSRPVAFAMSDENGGWSLRMTRLMVLFVMEAVLAALIAAYTFLHRKELQSRIRETNRVLRAVQRGVSYSKAVLTDASLDDEHQA